MKTSRLRNNYFKNNNEENRKLPNKEIIASIRKTKKAYNENLDERKVFDNKLFRKTVNPSLSEKFNARDRTKWSENGEIVKTEKETAEVFNNFFLIL